MKSIKRNLQKHSRFGTKCADW